MKKLLLTLFFILSACLLKALYSQDYIKPGDISKALNILGLNIYKYPLVSANPMDFNLLYEEFSDGKCVDSSRLISDEAVKKLKTFIGKSLTIQKDTTFLDLFVQRKSDSLFIINFSYSFFSSKKEIKFSKTRYGDHQLREFASPRITRQDKYPVLILSSSWEQHLNGVTVSRFCFPDNVDQIKRLVNHFYVVSVIAE